MKTTTIVGGVLCLGAGNCAVAQAQVTIYGIVDSGFVHQSDAIAPKQGNVSSLTGGGQSGSRFGLRGVEDLGNGLKATFDLEAGINTDTGTSTLGALFGRKAHVGLDTPLGNVKLGRQYSPFYLDAILPADPFGMGLMGRMNNVFSTNSRINNSVSYSTPRWRGWAAGFLYGLGEVAGNSSAARSYNGALSYQDGPARVALGYYNQRNAADTATSHSVALTGSYRAGAVTVYSAFQAVRSTLNGVPGATVADTNVNIYMAGLQWSRGPHTVLGGITHARDQRRIGATGAKATLYAVGYTYALSKRTNLYTSFGMFRNRSGAAYAIGDATTPVYGQKGFDVGIRHRF